MHWELSRIAHTVAVFVPSRPSHRAARHRPRTIPDDGARGSTTCAPWPPVPLAVAGVVVRGERGALSRPPSQGGVRPPLAPREFIAGAQAKSGCLSPHSIHTARTILLLPALFQPWVCEADSILTHRRACLSAALCFSLA